MTVSLIVPAFNYGAFLPVTLDSVLRQHFQDWELIVVDDGSTDDTASVVKKYRERDRRIVYAPQANQGVATARNAGLALAKGEYVQFLDADDLLENRKLDSQVRYLERNPQVDLVYGSARYFRSDHPDERRFGFLPESADKAWMPEVSGTGKEVQPAIVKANIMVVHAALVRRSLVDQVGPFDQTVAPLEDWDYWLRCALQGATFHYLDKADTLSLVRVHPSSASQNAFRMRRQQWELRRKWVGFLQDERSIEFNRMMFESLTKHIGIELAETGRPFAGARFLLRAARDCATPKEAVKWLYAAIAAPIAPKGSLEKVIYQPMKESLQVLLRLKR
jgi:glycosyltransferase involved in cell wall biosynthesis